MTARQYGVPTQEFQRKIGIQEWPQGVSLTVQHGFQRRSEEFFIASPGGEEQVVVVNTADGASVRRGYDNLRTTLVERFGAKAFPGFEEQPARAAHRNGHGPAAAMPAPHHH